VFRNDVLERLEILSTAGRRGVPPVGDRVGDRLDLAVGR